VLVCWGGVLVSTHSLMLLHSTQPLIDMNAGENTMYSPLHERRVRFDDVKVEKNGLLPAASQHGV
jgi:hypothetical protein